VLGSLICTMRLHYYAPPVRRSYCVGIHNGHGFGSVFAKLFSKVAAKTAAKAAVSAAKSAGKKALAVAAKKGVQLAKKAAKEGLKQAAEIGTELATSKINSLADSAINKNLPPEIVHSIRDIATRGVGTAGTAVQTYGTQKVHGLIDRGSAKAEHLGNRLIDRLPGGVASSPRTTTAVHKRKRKSQSQQQGVRLKKKKKRQQKSQSLASILDLA
jgi:hypothetical protein